MEYCSRCGTLLIPQRRGESTVLKCIKCGYEKTPQNTGVYRVTRTTRHTLDEVILMIEQEVRVETLPKARVECPRCENLEAYYWELQTRAGDEPTTRFFKCVKCGYVWREYQ